MTGFWRTFVSGREKSVLNRLAQNPSYQEFYQKQKKSQSEVDRILMRLPEEDSRIIRFYYRGEIRRLRADITEMYIQGMRDCIKFLNLFGMIDPKWVR